ncbi:hypothetical protein BDZ89DRAFT_694276 [Hymenopellis radicata]|nr:hypothetical protein BDZ89DRAFT_694276 [Hymenopellis radicata]
MQGWNHFGLSGWNALYSVEKRAGHRSHSGRLDESVAALGLRVAYRNPSQNICSYRRIAFASDLFPCSSVIILTKLDHRLTRNPKEHRARTIHHLRASLNQILAEDSYVTLLSTLKVPALSISVIFLVTSALYCRGGDIIIYHGGLRVNRREYEFTSLLIGFGVKKLDTALWCMRAGQANCHEMASGLGDIGYILVIIIL